MQILTTIESFLQSLGPVTGGLVGIIAIYSILFGLYIVFSLAKYAYQKLFC